MKKDLLFWCIAAFFTAMLCACGNKSDNKREIPDAGDSFEVKDGCSVSAEGVEVFKQNGLFGVKNSSGEIILTPQYGKVVHYGVSEVCDDEFAFWLPENVSVYESVPDAELFCDRLNLVLRKDTLSGIFSKDGRELLPVKYPEIYAMSAAGSYAVVENGDCLSVWKDGRFILSGCESGFYGTDLEKKRYVFADRFGKRWDFYDFEGKNHQRLTLKEAPLGVCLPQFLEPGRFLVDNCIVNARGGKLAEFPEWTEVCGNFLLVPGSDGKYDVFFNDGKKLTEGVDMAYMLVTENTPHLPTGDIVIDENGSFKLYDRNGKFANNVPGVVPVWVFAELSAAEHEGKVPVYSDYE